MTNHLRNYRQEVLDAHQRVQQEKKIKEEFEQTIENMCREGVLEWIFDEIKSNAFVLFCIQNDFFVQFDEKKHLTIIRCQ